MKRLLAVLLLAACGSSELAFETQALVTRCYRTPVLRMSLVGPATVRVTEGETPEGQFWSAQFDYAVWAAAGDDPDVFGFAEYVEVPCP